MPLFILRSGPELHAQGVPEGFHVLGRVEGHDQWVLEPAEQADLDADAALDAAVREVIAEEAQTDPGTGASKVPVALDATDLARVVELR